MNRQTVITPREPAKTGKHGRTHPSEPIPCSRAGCAVLDAKFRWQGQPVCIEHLTEARVK